MPAIGFSASGPCRRPSTTGGFRHGPWLMSTTSVSNTLCVTSSSRQRLLCPSTSWLRDCLPSLICTVVNMESLNLVAHDTAGPRDSISCPGHWMDQLPEAVLVAQDGLVIYANEAAGEIF